MYAIDFEYDGQCLSDYGFIICDFNYSNGSSTANAGSKLSFERVSHNSGKKYSLISSKYDECVSSEFDICKNPDIYDYYDREISNDEYRNIVRWLNRREFLKFRVFDEDNEEKEACYYNVSFNVDKIKIGEKLYGLHLTMESDKPFGYGQEQQITLDFSDVSVTKVLNDISDEIGYIYPDMIITCNQDGDLSIYNKLFNSTMLIKNCSAGEVITVNGDLQIISTTYNSHNSITFSTDVGSVKNCFKLEAGDDLMTATIANCNPNGSSYIWYISDEVKEDMSKELVNRLTNYDAQYAFYQNDYTTDFSKYENGEESVLNYNFRPGKKSSCNKRF